VPTEDSGQARGKGTYFVLYAVIWNISTCFALIAFKLTVFIMLPEDLTHTTQLSRFRDALSALPLSLPSGSSVYSFINWSPDPEMLEDYGAECSVLNAHLEHVFGLRAVTLLTFTERGPGIESLADLFAHYLGGDFQEKSVILKWLEDLTEAAEKMSASSNDSSVSRMPFYSGLKLC
jgi:hypothetical protein